MIGAEWITVIVYHSLFLLMWKFQYENSISENNSGRFKITCFIHCSLTPKSKVDLKEKSLHYSDPYRSTFYQFIEQNWIQSKSIAATPINRLLLVSRKFSHSQLRSAEVSRFAWTWIKEAQSTIGRTDFQCKNDYSMIHNKQIIRIEKKKLQVFIKQICCGVSIWLWLFYA